MNKTEYVKKLYSLTNDQLRKMFVAFMTQDTVSMRDTLTDTFEEFPDELSKLVETISKEQICPICKSFAQPTSDPYGGADVCVECAGPLWDLYRSEENG